MCRIKKDIIAKAKEKNIDPYNDPFAPKDLGLNAGDYGAFSDYCDNTTSSKHNKLNILSAVKFWPKSNRPRKYILKK